MEWGHGIVHERAQQAARRARQVGRATWASARAWCTAVPRVPLRHQRAAFAATALLALAAVGFWEARSSWLQSRFFAWVASGLSYEIGAGASDRIVFPEDGPFDRRLGYTRLGGFVRQLSARGFEVSEQARMSPALASHVSRGLDPPEWLPARPGLVVRSADGTMLYAPAGTSFEGSDAVPALVRESLLFIEDRQLGGADQPARNPAVNWGRLGRAGLLLAAGHLGLDVPNEGGSTLATQMEKFRHSAEGRTDSALEKLRQMFDASLKAYRDGPDTRDERRALVTHYLNSMPLSAAPGYGEVNGFGAGLWAWFGLELESVVRALRPESSLSVRAPALKHALALICAVREPSRLLLADRPALARRADAYLTLMAREGLIDAELARQARAQSLLFRYGPPPERLRVAAARKAVGAVRRSLLRDLGVARLYALDRLDLHVASTIDVALQSGVSTLLGRMEDPKFIRQHGLDEERLLGYGDPSAVLYSVLLYEQTQEGNLLRVQADSLDADFDLNEDMKLELGSTAKLRTLAHYLELVARLHDELSPLSRGERRMRVAARRDPLTRWAAAVLDRSPATLAGMLDAALRRTYSASPDEEFFTGGGVHRFSNFDRSDDARVLSVREATVNSVNLVYIRLMRDLVRYHTARLPYDARAVIGEVDHPARRRLLEAALQREDESLLFKAWKRLRGQEARSLVRTLLGRRAPSDRQLAILYFAWHPSPTASGLAAWIREVGDRPGPRALDTLYRAYGNRRLTLSDYSYLLKRRPMDVFAAGELYRAPDLSWEELWARSSRAREIASGWLFKSANRSAQQRRLRIQIERDAFASMTADWKRLGFPFDHLVPSLATAIGSSSDRPAALAELMGIILADGRRFPRTRMSELRFAQGTPYHSVLRPAPAEPPRVMHPAVARSLRATLAMVVEQGTARRVSGAIHAARGTLLVVGGKTGSGDNRRDTFSTGGKLVSSRVVNRTATFVFYIGHRYFGVITAFVDGPKAGAYRFTSALPVTILKLMAPDLAAQLTEP